MSAIILDTETTGIDDPEVIELACTAPLVSPDLADIAAVECTVQRFRPSKPISLGAMATHHIIDADLIEEAPWPGNWFPPDGVEYFIAHNVDFDHKATGAPHVARICTLALARALWPDVDSHSLSAMTYYLRDREEARKILRGAHSAATDLILCSWLLQDILRMLPGTMSWHQLWQHSERARIPKFLTFGKYGPYSEWAKANGQPKGLPIAELPRLDPGYRKWLLSGACDMVTQDPYLEKAIRGETA